MSETYINPEEKFMTENYILVVYNYITVLLFSTITVLI